MFDWLSLPARTGVCVPVFFHSFFIRIELHLVCFGCASKLWLDEEQSDCSSLEWTQLHDLCQLNVDRPLIVVALRSSINSDCVFSLFPSILEPTIEKTALAINILVFLRLESFFNDNIYSSLAI